MEVATIRLQVEGLQDHGLYLLVVAQVLQGKTIYGLLGQSYETGN